MKFAICNETFQAWPFEKAFAFARECGYMGIEIAPFTIASDVREISAAKRQEVKQQAEAAGLEVVGLHWLLAKTEGFYLTSPDVEVRERTTDYFKALAQLCRDLGGSVMVLGSPQQRNLLPGVTLAQATDYAVGVLEAALPELEKSQVTIALEPLGPSEGDFLNTAAQGVEMIKRINSPWIRLHLDCKAMSSESQPIPEIIKANREYMEHFHANDPNLLGPGFGELQFEPIFAALKEVGYSKWVSVEVFDYSPGIERLAQESMANMQTALPAAS